MPLGLVGMGFPGLRVSGLITGLAEMPVQGPLTTRAWSRAEAPTPCAPSTGDGVPLPTWYVDQHLTQQLPHNHTRCWVTWRWSQPARLACCQMHAKPTP